MNLLTQAPNIVKLLVDSDLELYLTGSRYWGHCHSNSDWDFFTEYSDEGLDRLLKMGFKPEISRAYNDMSMKCVLRYRDIGEPWVDVQLVTNAEHKLLVQNYLYETYPNGLPGDKSDCKRLWNDAFNLFYKALGYFKQRVTV